MERANVTMGVDADGLIVAARVSLFEDVGAYPTGGTGSVAAFVAMLFSGPYRVPSLGFSGTTVYTNTCGRAPYRGPWLMETVRSASR